MDSGELQLMGISHALLQVAAHARHLRNLVQEDGDVNVYKPHNTVDHICEQAAVCANGKNLAASGACAHALDLVFFDSSLLLSNRFACTQRIAAR